MAIMNWNGKLIDDVTGQVFEDRQRAGGNLGDSYDGMTSDRVMTNEVDPAALAQIIEMQKKLESEKHVRDQARGYDDSGRPVIKDFSSMIDPATGQLKDIYQLKKEGDVNFNADGYNEIKKLATRTGPSTWALMMQEKQKMEEANAVDRSRTQSLTAQNQALGSLAMRGGVSSGSRNRLAGQAIRNQMMNQQQVMNQGAMARQDIGVKDEGNRYDMLKNLTSLDAEKSKLDLQNRDYRMRADTTNLQNNLREVDAKRAYDSGSYQERMKGYAAEQASAGQRNAGGGK